MIDNERTHPTLLSWLANKYVPHKRIGKRATKEYRNCINGLTKFLGRPADLGDLTDDMLARYLYHMADVLKRSPATLNKHRAHLLALWRFAAKKKLIPSDLPDVDKAREYERVPEAWTVDEFGRILEATAVMIGRSYLGIKGDTWWIAFLLVMYDTGLRCSALLSLPGENFNGDRGIVRAEAETQKHKGEQVFELHSQTVSALAALGTAREGRLLPWPYDPGGHRGEGTWKALTSHYRRILRAAGLPTTEKDLLHKVRRTSASYFAAKHGRDAAQFHLGHSSPAVTARYIDPRICQDHPSPRDTLPRPQFRRQLNLFDPPQDPPEGRTDDPDAKAG